MSDIPTELYDVLSHGIDCSLCGNGHAVLLTEDDPLDICHPRHKIICNVCRKSLTLWCKANPIRVVKVVEVTEAKNDLLYVIVPVSEAAHCTKKGFACLKCDDPICMKGIDNMTTQAQYNDGKHCQVRGDGCKTCTDKQTCVESTVASKLKKILKKPLRVGFDVPGWVGKPMNEYTNEELLEYWHKLRLTSISGELGDSPTSTELYVTELQDEIVRRMYMSPNAVNNLRSFIIKATNEHLSDILQCIDDNILP